MNRPFFILLWITFSLFAQRTTQNSIVWDGPHFTYSLKISSTLSPNELYSLFASDSATVELKGAADTVIVNTNGQNKKIVTTIMNTLGHRLVTITDKKQSNSERNITLDILKFDHAWDAIPRVTKGGAIYSIRKSSTGSELIYQQNVYLNRGVNGLAKMLISWQLKPFHRDIMRLIHAKETE